MYKLLPLIEKMLTRHAVGSAYPISLSYKIKRSFIIFSGVMLLATVGFGLYALYLWLNLNATPVETMAYMALATFTVALVSAFLAFLILYIKVSKARKMKKKFETILQEGIYLAEQELGEPILQNPKSAVALASTAGFMVGERFL